MRKRKGEKNVKVRSGKIYADKKWPDGTRHRRVMPTMEAARDRIALMRTAIANNTWRQLREDLESHGKSENLTLEEFSKVYLDFCQNENRRPDFKRHSLVSINRELGQVRLIDIGMAHIERFKRVRLNAGRSAHTVNRNLAVLKHLLGYAASSGYAQSNPLAGLRLPKEPSRALRVMTIGEERSLVNRVAEVDLIVGIYVAILGETGLRKGDGLALAWDRFDLQRRLLSVGTGKTGQAVYVPLSSYALYWLGKLQRIVGRPWVFCRGNGRPVKDPRGPFQAGKEAAGLNWVRGFHDLRHFRATQWLRNGVDVRTVKELLGHKSITTTERYLHLAREPRSVMEAFERDEAEIITSTKMDEKRTVQNG